MARDFGARKRRGPSAGVLIALVVTSVAAIVATHYFLDKRAKALAEAAKLWEVFGPPCPSLTREAYMALPEQATQVTDINGVRWARAHATLMCRSLSQNGAPLASATPICQFSYPGVLRVTTARGDYFFKPERAATVTVRDGVASCVAGSSVDFAN